MGVDAPSDPAARDPLDLFLEPVAAWFRNRFASLTPPQRLGWPSIVRGEHTLIVAPTGSGKTLAAFLACLNHLWAHPPGSAQPRGTELLYLSPLKALNVDVARNLVEPLEGIQATAQALGAPIRPLRLGVRTGDTPPAQRACMIRRPPNLLITTPESLHLLLTSRARQTLSAVRFVIVDEIHALAGNKRGVFLSLLLERLQALQSAEFLRIGLSATQRPLDEVARFLGGRRKRSGHGLTACYEPRPVTIVDAGIRKELDLLVHAPRPASPGGSVWPEIEADLLAQIGQHRSTLIFANNRRVVERLAAALNQRAAESDADPVDLLARPHHGSLSPEVRRATESALKDGRLRAVVATASLELGIDMAAVDLVCQVESPGSVARALQRVGRAGHVVGSVSRGRIYAKSLADLLESAALVRAMRRGEVEQLRVPTNCLDVLAQQVVSCVAQGPTDVLALYDLVRSAYPYAQLPLVAFEDVLRMVSGRFGLETFRDLRPRISWDRVHQRLLPLPGTAALALTGGGTIPDSGQFPLVLGDNGPRLGELDEEFVLERRIGETFRLGHGTWRIEAIEPHRVVVSPAAGHAALLPFWRGEAAGRSPELGQAVAELARLIREDLHDGRDPTSWLASDCGLDLHAARRLTRFVARQIASAGAVPDDRTILVESFPDPAGGLGLAILTPYGHRFHHALKLALLPRLRQRLGLELAALHADDGLLFRLPDIDTPPLDVLAALTPDLAEQAIREELGHSSLFGLRFRQNAARALLMPRPDPTRRTPLWLQRLRARDLLQTVRRHPDFPVVLETYRECLVSDLDLPCLRRLLESIQDGSTRVVTRNGHQPSPFAAELIFQFTQKYLYEWDEPRRDQRPVSHEPDHDRLNAILDGGWPGFRLDLDPAAVDHLNRRLRGQRLPRSLVELAEWLRQLGDLAPSELPPSLATWLDSLIAEGRITRFSISGASEPELWISSEDAPLYAAAFAAQPDIHARATILQRFAASRALVSADEAARRYGLELSQVAALLESLTEAGQLARLDPQPQQPTRWADRRNLAELRRTTLALRRRDSLAVTPETFVDFLLRDHQLTPPRSPQGASALAAALLRLEGFAAPLEFWESELLPRRLPDFQPAWLAAAVRDGIFLPRGRPGPRDAPLLAFFHTAEPFTGSWPQPPNDPLTAHDSVVLQTLQNRGACLVDDLLAAAGLKHSELRSSLLRLFGHGLVTLDHLDALRSPSAAALRPLTAARTASLAAQRPRLGRRRATASPPPQPRWRLWPASLPPPDDPDTPLLAWAERLLDRYAILCRETVALDPAAPPWRDLVDPLERAELRGELRRGYFVEGLSGVQYTLPETADALARHQPNSPPTLINTLDPANLYGSGAPFDIPLLDNATARLPRSPANFLVLASGRPILIIEAYGRRLTGLPSASDSELQAALSLLPALARPPRRTLKIETYNSTPALSSPAAAWLADLGFVRHPPGMAFYAKW
ncbi:MAG: DEAD/DEAH box helicase [Isosphaeraceae bacterium]|nr:MAG: DEAD/DEAH box helicase [Isosphaeraceae bacterium]